MINLKVLAMFFHVLSHLLSVQDLRETSGVRIRKNPLLFQNPLLSENGVGSSTWSAWCRAISDVPSSRHDSGPAVKFDPGERNQLDWGPCY